MFVIYGQGKSKEKFGPIKSLNCKNCKTSNEWMVEKSTNWLTLYFIPIIPINKHSIHCSNCQYKEIIPKVEYKIYLGFLSLSNLIGITGPNAEQLKLRKILEEKLTEYNSKKIEKIKSEIYQFHAVISKMSDTDLIHRYYFRQGYSSTFLMAVEEEIAKRKINP